MTQQDFDSLRFCAGMLAEYGGHWYKVISCNFPERLFALYDDAGIDADDPMSSGTSARCRFPIIRSISSCSILRI